MLKGIMLGPEGTQAMLGKIPLSVHEHITIYLEGRQKYLFLVLNLYLNNMRLLSIIVAHMKSLRPGFYKNNNNKTEIHQPNNNNRNLFKCSCESSPWPQRSEQHLIKIEILLCFY